MASPKPDPLKLSSGQVSDPDYVHQRLAELRPILAGAVVGDFSTDIKIPEQEDEFTELFVGVQMMVEVIRDQLQELTSLNQSLKTKATERRLALEEAQAMTHLGSWQWDITTGTITWSDELYRIYGMKPQERPVSYEEFLALIHPDDRNRVSRIITQSSKSGGPFEFEHRIVLPDGIQRILQGKGKVITNKAGKPVRMLGTAHDITERKNTERALEQSDERFRAVTRATSDVVYDLDLQNGTLWFNEALYSGYGYDKKQVEDTLEWWTAHIHPDDALSIENQLSELLASDKRTWDTEYRFLKADGTYVTVRNRAFVLRDDQERPCRIIGSLLDITQQKQLDRAKDEFMSLVSHQLRTPLTIIRVYSEMLSSGMIGPITDAQHNHVQKINDACVRLIDLVGNLLDISRIELERIKINPVPTDINKLIRTHIDELLPVAKDKGAKLSFKPDTALPLVPLDTTVFGHVIYNLLENAINYTLPDHGQVLIQFARRKTGYVLSIKDNGIGIPKADQPYIFERFYRADNSTKIDANGTGLGLYLVRLIVDTFGGKLWFTSSVGKGTTFYVQLPSEGMQSKPVQEPA